MQNRPCAFSCLTLTCITIYGKIKKTSMQAADINGDGTVTEPSPVFLLMLLELLFRQPLIRVFLDGANLFQHIISGDCYEKNNNGTFTNCGVVDATDVFC